MNRKPAVLDMLITSAAASSAFSQTRAPAAPHAITLDRAQTIALTRVPGTVRHSELEREHGRWIYSFEIRTPARIAMEVNVDADSGAIVEVSRD